MCSNFTKIAELESIIHPIKIIPICTKRWVYYVRKRRYGFYKWLWEYRWAANTTSNLTGILLIQCETVFIYCDPTGRFDHSMGMVNTLYKTSSEDRSKHLKLYILGSTDVLWLLKPGHHTIRIPSAVWSEKSHCGLLPIGYPCRSVSTKGLKWDLSTF